MGYIESLIACMSGDVIVKAFPWNIDASSLTVLGSVKSIFTSETVDCRKSFENKWKTTLKG